MVSKILKEKYKSLIKKHRYTPLAPQIYSHSPLILHFTSYSSEQYTVGENSVSPCMLL